MQPNNVLKLYSVDEDTTLHMNISQVVWSRKFDHFWTHLAVVWILGYYLSSTIPMLYSKTAFKHNNT